MKRLGRILILAGVLGCAPAAPPGEEPAPATPRRSGQTVSAKVLTVRESSHPPTRAFVHKIVIAGSKVRLGEEKDQWRLFDLDARTVTWVDDVARTHRTVTLGELLRARERQLRQPIPAAGLRPVAVRPAGEPRVIAGIRARPFVFELGGYRREVWLSEEVLVGPLFLRMLIASEPISEPWAGVMREVHRTLLAQQGFAVLDRSRLAWEGGQMLVQRQLLKVETRDVPAEWLRVPAEYEDLNSPESR